MKVCGNAINVNEILIQKDQTAYHEDLKERYEVLKTKIADYVGQVTHRLMFKSSFVPRSNEILDLNG